MNKLKVTQFNKWFAVDIGDSRIHMLNRKSLVYFLKRQVGLDGNSVNSILDIFEHSDENVVEIDLNNVTRRVS